MRARWLKPEFFTDKKIAMLGPLAALVFEALWVIADDGGTAKGDAETLKAQVFYRWSTVTVPDISTALRELSHSGRVRRYQVGDDEYTQIVHWTRHQQVHKPGKFRHPKPEKGAQFLDADAAHVNAVVDVAENSAETVPERSMVGAAPNPHSGTSAAPLPASPPPILLDSETPKQPVEVDAGARDDDGNSTERADLSAVTKLTVAANRGLAEHPTKPQLIARILPTSGSSLEATEAILQAGVPLVFAEAQVYAIAKSHTVERVRSLNYFVDAVIRAWQQDEASRAMNASTPPKNTNGRRTAPRGRPSSGPPQVFEYAEPTESEEEAIWKK
jgi:hypothetical protein